MSTYLALTFGTLLSSQGTDTSFKPLSQALRALRSFVFPAYQIRLSAFSASLSAFRFRPFGFPLSQTLAEFLFRNFLRKGYAEPSLNCSRGFRLRTTHAAGATRRTLRTRAPRVKPAPGSRAARGRFTVTSVVRPRPRPAGSSGGGGSCPPPTCRWCGAPTAGLGAPPARRCRRTCAAPPPASAPPG